MRLKLLLLIGTALLWVGARAYAWSYKEHVQLTRIAVARLLADPATPADMKDWLRQAVPNTLDMAGERAFLMSARVGDKPAGFEGDPLLYWSYLPDVRARHDPRDVRRPPFDVHERLHHFVDLELFQPPDAKKGYRHDGSGKPKIDDVPRNATDPRFRQAGYLPLRIEQCYGELVRAIRAGRLHAPSADAHEADRTATYWAGHLAHYLADNTQPHHATLDYKSQSYFANRRKAPNVHSEMEFRLVDDEHEDFPELRAEYWKLFEAALIEGDHPTDATDPFRASLEASFISYDALPLIGEAAMRAAGQRGTPDKPEGGVNPRFDTEAFMRHRGTYLGREMSVMEMKAHQTAWAVKRIENALRQAWKDAKGE
jgi:hypothetical protein